MDEQTAGIEFRPSDDLLAFDEAVKFLDTSKSTLYRLLSQEEIKGVKVGKQWRFRKTDLIAYLERGPVAVVVDAAARADLDTELDFFAEEWLAAELDPRSLETASDARTPEAKILLLADRIIQLAIASGSSDIHMEPMPPALRLRYRIDGVLHDIRRMPMSLHEPLIARFKEMSEMNFMEKRVPQDGRAATHFEEKHYDLRMSILPTIHGENVVMRILDRNSLLLSLDKLGMSSGDLDTMRAWMRRSSGTIIVTGPTGAGKTTLLYSCLKEIDTAKKKILTIEDPVECPLTDVTQVQVNRRAGLTFAGALRSFLRQDPDVILCGAMRDLETAEIAIEASVTGHLVLSVLHTEDAPSALLRLVDIGIVPFLVTATLNGVIAVRLARRLCENCKTPVDPEESRSLASKVKRAAESGGYSIPAEATFYTAVGCERCRRTGYQGRIGLFEVLPCSPRLTAPLLQCASNDEMTRMAVLAGMRTLFADGMRKAVEGQLSIDEVLRATGTWL